MSGSVQLRRFRCAIRDGIDLESAAAASDMSIGEARLWVAADAENPPGPECYEMIGRQSLTVPSKWQFGNLVPFRYGVILIDPMWDFKNYSAKGEAKNPNQHYACESVEDMAVNFPVGHLAAPDCAMFMWATAPMLDQGLWLMKQYGFTFKSAAAWAKQSSTGNKWAFGPGYTFRSACEFILLGTIGSPKVISHSVRNLIVAPVREHSRKPDDLHRMAEAMYAGPRCEIFGRESRDGWEAWGNQADKFDMMEKAA
jgi:N6-adenosine-specific RNA methylase IME4